VRQVGGPNNKRSAGILLHVTSLPGQYGTGDLGPHAFAFVDALAQAHQRWWQILPLGPPGSGDSPYQCYSAFAGNPDLVSPELLLEEQLVGREELESESFAGGDVDFARVGAFKRRLIDRAWESFRTSRSKKLDAEWKSFRKWNADWLEDYALFMALREEQGGRPFSQWPRGLGRREPRATEAARERLAGQVDREAFGQFLFFRQLAGLRAYARERGVGIVGDLPMFVSPDSADVWANPELFLLDERRRPKVVAGVPPDYFSKTGQRWGNPLYDWRAMRRSKFDWWVRRVKMTLKQCDLIRIDHFRGFEACWQVPASRKTAKFGKWVKSPGKELLGAIARGVGRLPFIAEDLGLITPGVERLRDEFGLPGMKVLQFAFGGDDGTNPFLPHNHVRNCVAYTGTHDNDTAAGWYASLAEEEKKRFEGYAPDARAEPAHALMRLTWMSVAITAIAPVQDVLGLGSAARMNTPGKATGNWRWRMEGPLTKEQVGWLGELTRLAGRASRA
jgi:4-alpha-glucanotransferase